MENRQGGWNGRGSMTGMTFIMSLLLGDIFGTFAAVSVVGAFIVYELEKIREENNRRY